MNYVGLYWGYVEVEGASWRVQGLGFGDMRVDHQSSIMVVLAAVDDSTFTFKNKSNVIII